MVIGVAEFLEFGHYESELLVVFAVAPDEEERVFLDLLDVVFEQAVVDALNLEAVRQQNAFLHFIQP